MIKLNQKEKDKLYKILIEYKKNNKNFRITVRKITKLIEDSITNKNPHEIRKTQISKIITETTIKHGTSIDKLLRDNRSTKIRNARREICLRLREELDLSFEEIGTVINRNVGSVYRTYQSAKKAEESK